MPLQILAVASEMYPFVKTGGLADVVGALPHAFPGDRVTVTTLLPGYPAVKQAIGAGAPVLEVTDLFGGGGCVLKTRARDVDLFVLDAPHLFDRPGNPYTGPDGQDWPDNAFRFGALCLIAAQIGFGAVPDYRPDVIHGHDWQAGLTMAYFGYDTRRRPATLLTVHNLSFQGQFPAELLEPLRLPSRAFSIEGVESYGKIGFLKAGLHFADRVTTVSPSYAREIQTPAQGCGLDGLLRARTDVLSGICNGIDIEVWNPDTDPRIAARYGPSDLGPRRQNKVAVQRRFGLEETAERLLFAVVSRLAWQKGLDLLADAAPSLARRGAQLAILGTGEAALEQRLQTLARSRPDALACIIGYDEDLSHLIQAGADVIAVPSRFEPCGLTQLCAMRYGTIPLVAKVGGLADTVTDLDNASASGATGIQFMPVTPLGLESGLARTFDLWSDKAAWRQVQANGMDTDVSWAAPADQYLQIYRELVAHGI